MDGYLERSSSRPFVFDGGRQRKQNVGASGKRLVFLHDHDHTLTLSTSGRRSRNSTVLLMRGNMDENEVDVITANLHQPAPLIWNSWIDQSELSPVSKTKQRLKGESLSGPARDYQARIKPNPIWNSPLHYLSIAQGHSALSTGSPCAFELSRTCTIYAIPSFGVWCFPLASFSERRGDDRNIWKIPAKFWPMRASLLYDSSAFRIFSFVCPIISYFLFSKHTNDS